MPNHINKSSQFDLNNWNTQKRKSLKQIKVIRMFHLTKADLKISVGNKDLRDEKLYISSWNGQGQQIKPAGVLFWVKIIKIINKQNSKKENRVGTNIPRELSILEIHRQIYQFPTFRSDCL